MTFRYVLKGFPLPCSSNKYLMPSNNRLIKTNAARIYDSKVHSFKIRHFRKLEEIEAKLKGRLFRVDYYFVFAKKRIIGVQNQIKKLDYSSFLKLSQDGLAFCLGVDDMFIKSGFCEMIQCDLESQEQVVMVITPHEKIKTLSEVLLELS